jgi:hypothetical protein
MARPLDGEVLRVQFSSSKALDDMLVTHGVFIRGGGGGEGCKAREEAITVTVIKIGIGVTI